MDSPRIEPALGNIAQAVGTHVLSDVGKVESAREMVTFGGNQAHAHERITVETPKGLGQLLEKLHVGSVALVGPIEAHLENVIVFGDDDAIHGGHPFVGSFGAWPM